MNNQFRGKETICCFGTELYGDLYDAFPIPDGFEQVHELKYEDTGTAAESGLFYLLGTNGFTEDYKNPYKRCLIDAASSPLKGGCQISSFVGLQHDVDYAITKHAVNAFVAIDLKENHLIPTQYVLRNYLNGDHFWITGWNLEGSNDGASWTVLDKQRRNNQLRGKGTVCCFEIKGKHGAFSRFRVILKDVNNNQSAWELSLLNEVSTRWITNQKLEPNVHRSVLVNLKKSPDLSWACPLGQVPKSNTVPHRWFSIRSCRSPILQQTEHEILISRSLDPDFLSDTTFGLVLSAQCICT